ncbi:steroid 5-alpha reductase family enzyme [Luteimonas cucumeris]|uniref:Steroid 5-alpha reductase family enzyme n=1 Tax=Luteimonas cucumeris TaxID=985012 RepID=A0A562KZY2_9GAMM|nr:DUF1295 domain-containing protein [Luteimonas cucumeris]TWI00942.1 steroid 5-alpha reductase family enzyme [Luteimonas cucumeris]
MTIWILALWIWGISAVAMTAMCAFSIRARNLGYAGVAWAGLMAVAALLAGLLSEGAALPRTLTAIGGAIWGARLCIYLLHRVLHEDEDGRCRVLRATWGNSRGAWFLFFQVHALAVAVLALPFLAAGSATITVVDGWVLAAIAVWIVAVTGESLADAQLASFRADPGNRGRTCRDGLWAWSRHPNYFFEWLHWFAYVLLATSSPHAWLSWLGPALMLLFLYGVSGIPLAEQQALRSRGEDYRRYQREVSAFTPLPASTNG